MRRPILVASHFSSLWSGPKGSRPTFRVNPPMTLRPLLLVVALATSFTGCRAEPAANASQSAPGSAAVQGLARIPLTIRSGNRSHAFTVELAGTPDEQARGLMFRRSLGADQGMLFPYSPPQPVSFWMRNTYIPLDMIFIRPDGTIARIAANTRPLTDDPVSAGEPTAAVLELRGGRAAELGISEGDRVSWDASQPYR